MKHGIHEINSFGELRDIRSSVLGRSDFTVEHRCLIPDENDQRGKNLGYFESGKLLSSLRALPVSNSRELEENMDYRHCADLPLTYPGIVFGKACTYPEGRGKGNMRELFSRMVSFAESRGYRFIALTTMPTNPLNGFLIEQGFTRVENPEGWHRFGYESHGPTYLYFRILERA